MIYTIKPSLSHQTRNITLYLVLKMEVPVFMCNFKDNLSFCSMETYQESASHLPSN